MVIDHSVILDVFGRADAFERNVELEYQRNGERYQFLRWGQGAFADFKVVPGHRHRAPGQHRVPGPGRDDPKRCRLSGHLRGHRQPHHDGERPRRPGLGRRRHRSRGRHAGSAGLDAHPRVVGFKLTGEIKPGVTATDVVLTVTEMLRKHGVVGKFVEFYGKGVAEVPWPTAPPWAT